MRLRAAADLQQMGFSVVLYAVTALFAATRTIDAALRHLHAAGTPAGGPEQMNYGDFSEIVDLNFFKRLDDRFGV